MEILKGKIALITGASGGIGSCIARRFAQDGISLALLGRSEEKLAATAASVREYGVETLLLPGDLLDDAYLEDCFAAVKERFGGLDILVNNAGIARGGPLESMTLADIDALINVNIRGVVIAIQEALVHMSDGGRIINIGSCLANRVAQPGIAVYSMTKSALNSLTRGLARDLGPRGITVNLVHPGPTNSDMNPEDGEQADSQRQLIALGHYGQPEDVAAAVTFLASPAAGQISGTGLDVDGGLNA